MRMIRVLIVFATSIALITAGCSEHPQVPTAPRALIAPSSEGRILEQEGYVLTPVGWFHRSCVHEIPSGASRVGNVVTLPSGASYQIPKCQYPAYPNALARAMSRHTDLPADTNYVEYANYTPSIAEQFRHLSASLIVPSGPDTTYASKEIYYTFPGLSSHTSPSYILQPVLSWGNNGIYGGDYWSLSSWHCSFTISQCTHSTPIYPSVGDSLYGTMDASSCTGVMCQWTVTAEDVTKGTSTTRTWADSDKYFNAVGGAVETHHGFTSCSDFPTQPMVYTGISISDVNGAVTPVWTRQYGRTSSPDCAFKIVFPSGGSGNVVALVENPLAVSVSAAPSPAPPYSDVTAYANATGGLPPYTVAWSVNGVQACGNQWSCTAQVGAEGATTTFMADVTDAQPESADGSASVYAGCTPSPCQYKPAKIGSGG